MEIKIRDLWSDLSFSLKALILDFYLSTKSLNPHMVTNYSDSSVIQGLTYLRKARAQLHPFSVGIQMLPKELQKTKLPEDWLAIL